MPKVEYSYRILCDDYFIKWISTHTKEYQIWSKLVKIKASSKRHKKHHNIIIDADFKKIRSDINDTHIRAMVKPKSISEMCSEFGFKIEQKDIDNFDDITMRVVGALLLSSSHPYNTVILTTNDNKEKYINNDLFKTMTSVIVKSEEDAIQTIENMFMLYTRERDSK